MHAAQPPAATPIMESRYTETSRRDPPVAARYTGISRTDSTNSSTFSSRSSSCDRMMTGLGSRYRDHRDKQLIASQERVRMWRQRDRPDRTATEITESYVAHKRFEVCRKCLSCPGRVRFMGISYGKCGMCKGSGFTQEVEQAGITWHLPAAAKRDKRRNKIIVSSLLPIQREWENALYDTRSRQR